MAGPDDLLNPGEPEVSLDAFASDFGAGATVDEFDMPPPPPRAPAQPRPLAAQPAGDVQVTIKAPRAAPAQAQAKGPPPNDPLAWLSSAEDGMFRIRRKAGKLITSQGHAKRGRYKGKFVGVGECGVTEIMPMEEIRQHIIDNWGGGTYTIEHVDAQGKKTRDTPPMEFPQDPLPIEGVSDEDDEDDDSTGFEFLQPQAPPQQVQPQYTDVYGNPMPPPLGTWQVPQHPQQSRVFIPPYVEQNMNNERDGLKSEVENEREARRKAEAAAAQAQAERERDRERGEAQRAQDAMRAELQAMREAMKAPAQDSGSTVMLQMMMEQTKQAQNRWEQEAKDRRDRDERESRERRESASKEEKDRREREERLEKERREDRRIAAEAAAASSKQNQEFMTMVLSQKVDPLKLYEAMNGGKNQSNPLAAIDTAFAVVERAQAMAGGGGGGGDDEEESGVLGAVKAGAKAFRPIAEAWARNMSQPQQPQYVRVPVQQVQQQNPAAPQIPQNPNRPQTPQAPSAPAAPVQPSTQNDRMVFDVAKIVGIAGKGFSQNRAPETIAAVMLGAAEMAGLSAHLDMLAAADPTMIQQQIQQALNAGLPPEPSAQMQSFLEIYDKPGGREWLKEVLAELVGGDDEDEDEDEDDEEGE